MIGDYVYRHPDGREFRVKPERWSGGKHEQWSREGYEVIEVIGSVNQKHHEPGANEAFSQAVNPKPPKEERERQLKKYMEQRGAGE